MVPFPPLFPLLSFLFGALLAGLAIGALVRLSKRDFASWPDIQSRLRPLYALALGAAWGALDHLALGSPVKDALLKGLLGAVSAMLAHELGIERMRGGRELFQGKKEDRRGEGDEGVDGADVEVPPSSPSSGEQPPPPFPPDEPPTANLRRGPWKPRS